MPVDFAEILHGLPSVTITQILIIWMSQNPTVTNTTHMHTARGQGGKFGAKFGLFTLVMIYTQVIFPW